ncbi:MAG TPA: MEDS domain-containing protein [Acidobacteriaceae bacterium]|nr:MEDS domain-containing protein [Acidobacteriaceae bacterium]
MGSTGSIPLGITEDDVPLGSHLVHFWQNEEEFERGVHFLELGLENDSQYCVLFGHDEANQRVLEILRRKYSDVDGMVGAGRIAILRRDSSAAVTLARIDAAFAAAMQKGATAIRYLGNLGVGQTPLPGRGADEVIEIETGATRLAELYPCVIVCMYDVNSVSGRLLLNAGFGTHAQAVCGDVLQQNPRFDSEREAHRQPSAV